MVAVPPAIPVTNPLTTEAFDPLLVVQVPPAGEQVSETVEPAQTDAALMADKVGNGVIVTRMTLLMSVVDVKVELRLKYVLALSAPDWYVVEVASVIFTKSASVLVALFCHWYVEPAVASTVDVNRVGVVPEQMVCAPAIVPGL